MAASSAGLDPFHKFQYGSGLRIEGFGGSCPGLRARRGTEAIGRDATLKIERRETPFSRLLYSAAKRVGTANLPLPRFLHPMLRLLSTKECFLFCVGLPLISRSNRSSEEDVSRSSVSPFKGCRLSSGTPKFMWATTYAFGGIGHLHSWIAIHTSGML